MLFEARRDGSEVFELIEEALDEVSELVELGAERTNVDAAWHRFDVGQRPAGGRTGAQGVTVIAAIGEEERLDTTELLRAVARQILLAMRDCAQRTT